jgi:hypothetical protein
MGSDLKQGLMSSLKNAWQTLNDFARAHTSSAQLQAELAMVASRIKEEEEKQQVQEGEWATPTGRSRAEPGKIRDEY